MIYLGTTNVEEIKAAIDEMDKAAGTIFTTVFWDEQPEGRDAWREAYDLLMGWIDRTRAQLEKTEFPGKTYAIGAWKTRFLSDGTLKVGCLLVPKETIEEMIEEYHELFGASDFADDDDGLSF